METINVFCPICETGLMSVLLDFSKDDPIVDLDSCSHCFFYPQDSEMDYFSEYILNKHQLLTKKESMRYIAKCPQCYNNAITFETYTPFGVIERVHWIGKCSICGYQATKDEINFHSPSETKIIMTPAIKTEPTNL